MTLKNWRGESLSVFVVEDEALVLMNLEDMLDELGCRVVGPAMRIGSAMEMLNTGLKADAAILDVNVGGERVFGVAKRLVELGVPILFATGYGRAGIPDDLLDHPTLQKPYTLRDVVAGLEAALDRVSREDA